MTFSLTTVGFLLSFLSIGEASRPVVSVHGSGGSSPSRCFGHVMEELETRSKLPVRFSYRATGSTVGLTELKNDFNATAPLMDFTGSEIPLPSEDWQAFQEKNVTVMHLPVLFFAVSFFHSVPNMPDLNLTSCVLARIFTRDIQDWSHPDIREINPGLMALFEMENADSLGASMPIHVCRREEGSSTTEAITEYLHLTCPQAFPEEMVGDLPPWSFDTQATRGSIGMNECIEGRSGSIGYNAAGHGWFAGLDEISIKNKYGRLLTSLEASANGGIGAKDLGILPDDPRADFSSVSLFDQDGEWTWPITLLSYIVVRGDLSFKTDPDERALLLALIEALFNPAYVSKCEEAYGFNLPTGPALDLAAKGIELLASGLDPDSPRYTFEDKTEAINGTGTYVFSAARVNFASVEREHNQQEVEKLKELVNLLEAKVIYLTNELEGSSQESAATDEAEFTAQYEAMILTALIVGCASLFLVLVSNATLFYYIRGKTNTKDEK